MSDADRTRRGFLVGSLAAVLGLRALPAGAHHKRNHGTATTTTTSSTTTTAPSSLDTYSDTYIGGSSCG